METFVGCQRGSASSEMEEECWVVAYESHGRASSFAAGKLIKREPSDEACGPEECTFPDEADDMHGGTATRKRGARRCA